MRDYYPHHAEQYHCTNRALQCLSRLATTGRPRVSQRLSARPRMQSFMSFSAQLTGDVQSACLCMSTSQANPTNLCGKQVLGRCRFHLKKTRLIIRCSQSSSKMAFASKDSSRSDGAPRFRGPTDTGPDGRGGGITDGRLLLDPSDLRRRCLPATSSDAIGPFVPNTFSFLI